MRAGAGSAGAEVLDEEGDACCAPDDAARGEKRRQQIPAQPPAPRRSLRRADWRLGVAGRLGRGRGPANAPHRLVGAALPAGREGARHCRGGAGGVKAVPAALSDSDDGLWRSTGMTDSGD